MTCRTAVKAPKIPKTVIDENPVEFESWGPPDGGHLSPGTRLRIFRGIAHYLDRSKNQEET